MQHTYGCLLMYIKALGNLELLKYIQSDGLVEHAQRAVVLTLLFFACFDMYKLLPRHHLQIVYGNRAGTINCLLHSKCLLIAQAAAFGIWYLQHKGTPFAKTTHIHIFTPAGHEGNLLGSFTKM
ncbi:CG11455 [Drosophila busckii]|uniref:CG11455 n=1 Tax=Drosophila busckii TaxID=30019 RepID=A0A0M5J5U4_DROBS|nr:CG11455 [Drosophila busckii]